MEDRHLNRQGRKGFPGRCARRGRALAVVLASSISFGFLSDNGSFAQTVENDLHADKSYIEVGSGTTLIWKSAGSNAFLSNVGLVAGSGETVVHPTVTTRYVLVTQNGETISTSSTVVSVNQGHDSAKASDHVAPDFHEYGPPIVSEHSATNHPAFLEFIHTLMEHRGFTVRDDFYPDDSSLTVYTEYMERPDLIRPDVRPDDHGMKKRQLAVYIKVYGIKEATKPIKCIVAVNIEHMRRSESIWTTDDNEDLRRSATQAIVDDLNTFKQ